MPEPGGLKGAWDFALPDLAWRTLIHLSNLGLAVSRNIEELLRVLDRFLQRIEAHQGEASDLLLRFGERTVSDRDLSLRQAHTSAHRGRQAAFCRDQHTTVGKFLDEFAHALHVLLS